MNAQPSTSTDPAAPYIRLQAVSKKFGGFAAVDTVSLEIRRGEIFCLLGGSGSGKTTLLRMLAGFETPSAGSIYIDGEDISARAALRRPVNMMFQSYALFPHMNVEKNVAFGLEQERLGRPESAGACRDPRARGDERRTRPQAAPALRRPAAAGGAGASARQAPEAAAPR